jgi:hypothetical protein
MPQKRCGLSFDCASMQMSPGLDPGDCPNYKTCGSAIALTPDEEFEFIRVRQQQQERVRLSRRQAARTMLRSRGCPQSAQSLGVTAQVEAIAQQIADLQMTLNLLSEQNSYIAPEGCETHRYEVKRPYGSYPYNQLAAKTAIFGSSHRPVKVIHLSHDDDPRNLEARAGIDRRNRLLQARTQLNQAIEALTRAIDLTNSLM